MKKMAPVMDPRKVAAANPAVEPRKVEQAVAFRTLMESIGAFRKADYRLSSPLGGEPVRRSLAPDRSGKAR
jgi:hypothetical protein